MPILILFLLIACQESPQPPTKNLYLALNQGDIEQIERHILAGTDMNRLNKDGLAPIHVAIRDGRIAVVDILLRYGVNIEQKDRNGLSPMEYAILNGRVRIAERLKQAGAAFQPDQLLMRLIRSNRAERQSIRYLIEQGANINQKDQQGRTPLLIAIEYHHYKLCKYLIDAGADVNIKNQQGISALHLAKKSPDIADLLKQNGATD